MKIEIFNLQLRRLVKDCLPMISELDVVLLTGACLTSGHVHPMLLQQMGPQLSSWLYLATAFQSIFQACWHLIQIAAAADSLLSSCSCRTLYDILFAVHALEKCFGCF